MRETIKWFSKTIFYGLWWVVYTIFGLIGAYDTILAQFFPDSKTLKPISSFIPKLEYWHWWILLLVAIIFAIGIGSFKLHNKVIKEIKEHQKIVHSDSASRLFAIDVEDYEFDVSPQVYTPKDKNAHVLKLVLFLTAFPAQRVEGIKLELQGDTYDSNSDGMIVGKDPVFQTHGEYIYFELPSNFRKQAYTGTLAIYVEGRKETKEIKFTYS